MIEIVQQSTKNTIKSHIDNSLMNKLKNILILLISLLAINGGKVNNMSVKDVYKSTLSRQIRHTHHVSVDNFAKDSTPNEAFNLEEDADDTEDDFMETLFSKNAIASNNLQSTHFCYYSHSHQSVKRFILYCSLKLHC